MKKRLNSFNFLYKTLKKTPIRDYVKYNLKNEKHYQKHEQLGHPIERIQYANELFDASEI